MSPVTPFRVTKLQQLARLVRESHATPLAGTPQLPPQVRPGETAVTFIGHSSFLIQTANLGLLIDPVFATRLILLRRQRRPGLRIRELPSIHAILLTHAHMDHLNLPSLRAVLREMRRRHLPAPIAIVPNGVADLVSNLGFASITELAWWQTTQIHSADSCSQGSESSPALKGRGFSPAVHSHKKESGALAPEGTEDSPMGDSTLTITATPAKHWGARMFKDTHRGFGGYALQSPHTPTLYHSGDTAYFHGFHEIGHRLQPEIALLPIGAYFPDSYRAVHTSPEEAFQAFLDLGPSARTLIPMHYHTFPLGREPMHEPLQRLLAAAARADARNRIHPLTEGSSYLPTP